MDEARTVVEEEEEGRLRTLLVVVVGNGCVDDHALCWLCDAVVGWEVGFGGRVGCTLLVPAPRSGQRRGPGKQRVRARGRRRRCLMNFESRASRTQRA